MPFSLSFLLKMTPTWAIDVFLITHVLLKKTKPILNTTTFPHVKTIEFTAGSNTFRFNPDNISHISIDQHYATFFIIITEGLKEVQVKASMKKIMDFLPPQQFCRIHRSHSVNLNQIERIISVEGNNSVKLKGSELVLPISRRQLIIVKSNFQKWMEAKLIQPTNPKLMTE
ncbi:LytTR family transcriptional regulator [bacterium]|nr:LytTR family transcriptional regulator [bacterium]